MLLYFVIALEPIFEEIDRGLHSGVSHSGLQEAICPGTPGGSRMWYATKCLGADLEMPQLYSSMPRVAYPQRVRLRD